LFLDLAAVWLPANSKILSEAEGTTKTWRKCNTKDTEKIPGPPWFVSPRANNLETYLSTYIILCVLCEKLYALCGLILN